MATPLQRPLSHPNDCLILQQAGVFHGFLPTLSFRCSYTVFGRLLSLATPTPSPLDGRVFLRFLDGSCCHGSLGSLGIGYLWFYTGGSRNQSFFVWFACFCYPGLAFLPLAQCTVSIRETARNASRRFVGNSYLPGRRTRVPPDTFMISLWYYTCRRRPICQI